LTGLLLAALLELNAQPGVKLLGVCCGMNCYKTQTYVTGFNDDGTIAGEVYASTTCPCSGRGCKPYKYSSWHSITWNLDGVATETLPWDGIAPDPAFTETDAIGDTIYDVLKPTSWGLLYRGMLEKPDNGYVDTLHDKVTEEP